MPSTSAVSTLIAPTFGWTNRPPASTFTWLRMCKRCWCFLPRIFSPQPSQQSSGAIFFNAILPLLNLRLAVDLAFGEAAGAGYFFDGVHAGHAGVDVGGDGFVDGGGFGGGGGGLAD